MFIRGGNASNYAVKGITFVAGKRSVRKWVGPADEKKE